MKWKTHFLEYMFPYMYICYMCMQKLATMIHWMSIESFMHSQGVQMSIARLLTDQGARAALDKVLYCCLLKQLCFHFSFDTKSTWYPSYSYIWLSNSRPFYCYLFTSNQEENGIFRYNPRYFLLCYYAVHIDLVAKSFKNTRSELQEHAYSDNNRIFYSWKIHRLKRIFYTVANEHCNNHA